MFTPSGEKTTRQPEWKKSSELQKEESELKKIIGRSYEKQPKKEKRERPDLVDNFNWVILRFRRMKKITQEELAREISEPVAAIKLAEEGIVPEHNYTLVKKIENALGINLIKEERVFVEQREEVSEKPKTITDLKKLSFDPNSAKGITIADLKSLKDKKNVEPFAGFDEFEEQAEEGKKE